MKLYCYYDKDADVFYLSQGKPLAKDKTQEFKDDIVLRFDTKTKKVKGFTILNFVKRLNKYHAPISLPIEATLVPATSLR